MVGLTPFLCESRVILLISYLVLDAFSTCSARALPNACKEQLCLPRFYKHTLLHSILFFHFHVSNTTLLKVEEHANGALT